MNIKKIMTSGNKKWKEESREEVFKKYGRAIDKVIYTLPDGSQNDFYIKRETNSVGIFALTEDNQIILVQQYRPGPDEIIIDVPCGYIDHDELPEHAAARELLEETGYEGKISFVTATFVDAYSTIRRHCFVATNCVKKEEPKLDKTEFIEVVFMTIPEYRTHLKKGTSTYSPAGYLGLDHLGLL
jgi:ADP-ribose pyrophosphatase